MHHLFLFFLVCFISVAAAGRTISDTVPVFTVGETGYRLIDDVRLPSHIDHEHDKTLVTILEEDDWSYDPSAFAYPEDLGANIWFKFRLKRGALKKGCVLHMYNGMIPLLKVYQKKDNRLVLIDSLGSIYPQDKRQNRYRDAIIELPYEEGEVTYYVMVNARYYHGFDVALRSYANLFNYAISEYYLLGVFYGILMLVLLYNIFHFILVRDRLYLFYGFYVLMAIISSASTDLTGYWQFWPGFPEINKMMIDQSKWVLSAAFTVYAINFLLLHRKIRQWMWIVAVVSGVYIVYNALVINTILPTSIWLFLSFLTLHLLTIWIAAWKRWRSGYRPAGIFLIGFSLLVLAFIGNYLRFWYMIPVNVPTNFIMHYGIFGEVLVLTYAMSFRFKQERQYRIRALKEKTTADEALIDQLKVNDALQEKVNKELEEKVWEKTNDLQEANQRLEEQAADIRSMNNELARLNGKLYHEKKRHQRARALKSGLTSEEFFEIFPDNITCYHLINDLKSATPYRCRKCGHEQFTRGAGLLSRRCTRCGYNESVTAETLFKGFRSPIQNGFYLLYLLVETDDQLSAAELARKSGLGTKTAWKLRKTVLEKQGLEWSSNWMDFILSD